MRWIKHLVAGLSLVVTGLSTRIHLPRILSAFASSLVLIVALTGNGFAEQEGGVNTEKTSSTAPASVAETVKQEISSENLHRTVLTRLEQAEQWKVLSERVAALEEKLDALAAGALNQPELINSTELDHYLRGLQREAEITFESLSDIVRRLESDGKLLESSARNWQERAKFLEGQAVPPAVLERAHSIKTRLEHANTRIRVVRDSVLLVLERALVLQVRLNDARALIVARHDRINAQRTLLEQAPIWRIAAPTAEFEHVGAELKAIWQMQRDYLAQQGVGLAGLFLGILALTAWLFTRGTALPVEPIERAYGRPFAAALLIALVMLGWLAHSPPRLFYEILTLLAPIPAAMVARRAIAVSIPLTLYGVALSTILLSLRGLVDASPFTNRILLMLQVICVVIPIAIDLRHGRLQQAFRWPGPGGVRVAALLVMAVAGVTAFHVIFGFTGLATSTRAGMGSILGAILVFGTTTLALYGAVRALLATPLAQCFHSVRDADPALIRVLRQILFAFATASVVLFAIGSQGLVPDMLSSISSLMAATLEVGTVSIAFKSVVMALAVVFATVALTGVVGFILDREIVPRLNLQPGSGYAIVTFTRWLMLIVGATLTMAALGIDMEKITLIAGALSVGIGFGLQNVINNFVSGLILIVERPVGVGDVIEWGSKSGAITRIGIRSSTVRTSQGAEILVPNGDLLSKEVVNWTRSDRQRRYDIDIDVTLGAEPERVMRLLAEAAGEVPEIMKTPPPRVVFTGFGETSLTFTLLAWVATVDLGFQAQNALCVAMHKKLEGAGIAPFSQREFEIRSADDSLPKMMGSA